MTATATRARPYLSGWCGTGQCWRCRGACDTERHPAQCSHPCHVDLTALATGQVPQCAAAALRALLTTDVRKGATA